MSSRIDPFGAIHLRQRYQRPEPRLALAPVVLDHARASMDVSDGLLKDLDRMCRASGVGARIEQDALPLSNAFRVAWSNDSAAGASALFAGDDYEILCAIAPDRAAAFESAADSAKVLVTRIGRFTPGPDVALLDARGQPVVMSKTGWDHF